MRISFSDEHIRTVDFFDANGTQVSMSFTVNPCCNCNAALAGSPIETTSLLQPPCSLDPVGFIVIGTENLVTDSSGHVEGWVPENMPATVSDMFKTFGNLSDDLGVACQNVLEAVYHLVRLDLGVVLENQIYNSNATLTMAALHKEVEFFKTSDRVPVMQYLRSTPRIKPLGSAITSVFVSTFAMLSALWTIFSIVAGALAGIHNRKPSVYFGRH